MIGSRHGNRHGLTWVLVEDVRPMPEKEKKNEKNPPSNKPVLQVSTPLPVPLPEIPVVKRGRGRPKTKPEVLYHRAPTAYNLFVKGVMAQVKAELPGASSKECMQRCAALWKEHKASLSRE